MPIDPDLLAGEAVTVVRPLWERDGLGERVRAGEERTVVEGVLVTPGATADLAADRPEGATVALTLSFPKDFAGSLRGCLVEARGEEWRVVGDPQRHDPASTPGRWNLSAGVTRADG